jgi:hypothetical protein
MDVRAISSFPALAPVEVPARAGSGASAPGDPRPRVQQARENVPPPGLIGNNTMVEFGRHDGTGAQVVKFIDKRTGEIINQMPAQQVLDAVTNLMRLVLKQES